MPRRACSNSYHRSCGFCPHHLSTVPWQWVSQHPTADLILFPSAVGGSLPTGCSSLKCLLPCGFHSANRLQRPGTIKKVLRASIFLDAWTSMPSSSRPRGAATGLLAVAAWFESRTLKTQ
jgi:hypothetical protein